MIRCYSKNWDSKDGSKTPRKWYANIKEKKNSTGFFKNRDKQVNSAVKLPKIGIQQTGIKISVDYKIFFKNCGLVYENKNLPPPPPPIKKNGVQQIGMKPRFNTHLGLGVRLLPPHRLRTDRPTERSEGSSSLCYNKQGL